MTIRTSAASSTAAANNRNHLRAVAALLLLLLTSSTLLCKAEAFTYAAAPRNNGIGAPAVVGNAAFRSNNSPLTKLSSDAASAGALEERGGGGGGSSSSEQGTGTATIPNEVFNLVKSIAGSGVLSLPYGVAAFGNAPSALVPAVAMIAVMGGLSGYTFGLIGRICQNTKTASYADAWDATLGSKLSPLIAFSCFFDCFAGNLCYSMILADTIVNLFAAGGFAVTRTQALLGVTGTVLMPMCFLKDLASLAPFSLVGIMGMLYTTVAMGIRYFGGAYAAGTGGAAAGQFFSSQLSKPVFGSLGASAALSPKSLILACMLSNAYIAHFNAPKFLAELKNNTMGRFNQVIGWSFGTCVLLYGLITGFGYLTFGQACNGLVLNNYSVQDKLMSLSRIAIAVSITCSYPLIFVGTRDGVLDLFKVKKRPDALLNKVTVGIMVLVTAMAAKLTDLGLVASIGGATFGTALVFVYPVAMFLKYQQQQMKKDPKMKRSAETIPACLIGILGIAMGAIGTVLSLQGAEL